MAESKKGQLFYRKEFSQLLVISSDPFEVPEAGCAKSNEIAYEAFIFEESYIITSEKFWRISKKFCDFYPVDYPPSKNDDDPIVPLEQHPFGQQKLRNSIMYIFQHPERLPRP